MLSVTGANRSGRHSRTNANKKGSINGVGRRGVMNKYKCVIIIEDTVQAESKEEAKKIMCEIKIQKGDVIAESEVVNYI